MNHENRPSVDLDADIAAFLEARFPGEAARFYHPVKIGSTPEEANRGAALILSGVKTATSSAPWHYPDGKLPFTGALSALIDGEGKPLAVLETTRIAVTPFGELAEDFAFDYGEGDRSLAWFRSDIGAWYRQEAERHGVEFNDETELICEWFEVHRA